MTREEAIDYLLDPIGKREKHDEAIKMAIKALEQEPCGNCVNKNILKAQMEYYGFHAPDMTITEFAEDLFSSCKPEPCEDAVDRQAALYALTHDQNTAMSYSECERRIRNLPPVQPEIVRCKDCKYGKQDEVGRWFCISLGCQIGNEDGSGFCADAERRKE